MAMDTDMEDMDIISPTDTDTDMVTVMVTAMVTDMDMDMDTDIMVSTNVLLSHHTDTTATDTQAMVIPTMVMVTMDIMDIMVTTDTMATATDTTVKHLINLPQPILTKLKKPKMCVWYC